MNKLLETARSVYHEYPRAFWTYNLIVFIDRLGAFMLYPFFALYLTQKFDIGMSTVGIFFAIFSVSGMVGTALGGALTDHMGRKVVLILSLSLSSLSALGMGFAPTIEAFFAVVAIVGTFSNIGRPAHEAVVADLLPPEKRAEGYGIIRVFFNAAAAIGPLAAALLIANSYLTLFLADATISLVSAAIVLLALPETKPQIQTHNKSETMKQTFTGYGRVFKDIHFLAFVGVTMMMLLVYVNMYSTLGVYLRDQHGLPELNYGWLLSINSLMVVALQFWVTRRLEKHKPLLMMAAGSLLYAIGFALYGFVSTFVLFVLAIVIITTGELVESPFQHSIGANFAPEELRGRYMAVSRLAWDISFTVGPFLAGLLLDSPNPGLLWVFAGILGMLATLGYIVLNKVHSSPALAAEPVVAD